VLVLEHAGFAQYNPEALAATLAQRLGGDVRLRRVQRHAQGRDLSPRVAARLGVGLAPDLTGFTVEGGPWWGSTPT
jgi:electron transfer flavoprotein alpha subunit